MIAPRIVLGSVLATCVLLAGCGQKGPLYMPGDEQAAEQYDPADAYENGDSTAADAEPGAEGEEAQNTRPSEQSGE
nr:lipoprotein [Halomonas sp. EAR18]